MVPKIYPSLISADLLNLEQVIGLLDPYVPGYHLDVMDGHFVPNLTWGPDFINAIAKKSKAPQQWVHLMVTNPQWYIEKITVPTHSIISFHIETKESIENIIKVIKEKKLRASLAISPKTPLEHLFPYAGGIDHILVMSVEPGRSGQSFLPETFNRIEELVAYRSKHTLKFEIGVDGGINEQNSARLSAVGVESFGVAKAIFSSKNIGAAYERLLSKRD